MVVVAVVLLEMVDLVVEVVKTNQAQLDLVIHLLYHHHKEITVEVQNVAATEAAEAAVVQVKQDQMQQVQHLSSVVVDIMLNHLVLNHIEMVLLIQVVEELLDMVLGHQVVMVVLVLLL